ncbi:hypothetical protein FRC12_023593 [Ceratobasidium sp. 428]|nr:hypothetical protein FRC12_023593 [Ceratobasidium sp. 428]
MRLSSILAVASVLCIGVFAATSHNSSDIEARWPWSKSQISFAGCTKAQQSQLKAAVKQANSYILDSTKYLTKLSKSGRPTSRYTTWFGSISDARVYTVLDKFKEIGDNPSHPRKLTAPAITITFRLNNTFTSGKQSQAGIIVHEFTHFLEYGGTKDYKYGHTECKALAASDPAMAVKNADSYALFAENTPRLS